MSHAQSIMSRDTSGFSDGRARSARDRSYSDLFPESLAREWDELAERVDASPFLRPGWIAAWWCAFGAGELEIRTVRRDGRLAALMPVARRHGALRSVTNDHTPQFGLLAEDPSAATELARTLFVGKPRRVSIAALEAIGDSTEACLRAGDEAGYRVAVRPFQYSPFLEIKGDWPEYESTLSRSLVAGLRQSQRRLERLGKVSVRVIGGGEQLQERLEEAFAVEASGWKGARGTAIQSHPETQRFYTDVARWAATQGMFRLFLLRLDQCPLAMFYALVRCGVCHLLKGGYDPRYGRFSPGKLLMRAVVSDCFSTGLSRIEFHGDAEPYKLPWASAVQEQKRFEAFSRSPAGQLAWATFAYGRPAAKRTFQILGIWQLIESGWDLSGVGQF